MSYLHANKIAHGDLKPDNFLLAINGHVKIADFGSSQLTRVGGFVKRTAGTPAFMAPEMCGGQPYQARLADVWALGVSLYMFVFGELVSRIDATSHACGNLIGQYCFKKEETNHSSLVIEVALAAALSHKIFCICTGIPNARYSQPDTILRGF